MKYKKIFLSVTILSIITINLTIPSYNSLPTGSLQLSQIAFANDNEEGNEGNDFKKCEQGNVSFFPAHGAIACLYCGDCLAHWVFPTYDGDCKLFNK